MARQTPIAEESNTSGTADAGSPTPAATPELPTTTEAFAASANWGDGGRFIINKQGERVSAEPGQTKE